MMTIVIRTMLIVKTVIMKMIISMMIAILPIMTLVRGGKMTRGKEGPSSCFVTAERATVGAQEL